MGNDAATKTERPEESGTKAVTGGHLYVAGNRPSKRQGQRRRLGIQGHAEKGELALMSEHILCSALRMSRQSLSIDKYLPLM